MSQFTVKDANPTKEVIATISGHFMRAGAAQHLIRSKASMPMMMNKGCRSKNRRPALAKALKMQMPCILEMLSMLFHHNH